MKFQNIYYNISGRLEDTALSIWATGDARMQDYIKQVFSREPLLAEPVFQNSFPWKESTLPFSQMNDLFSNSFIAALDNNSNGEYRFPNDRHPYQHQIESWKKLLIEKKSIAVTTGTGSGKTECFMLPVLADLYENCKDQQGVNAIFLYPLNALIGSQKKRIHKWCEALGGIKYAIYNGKTVEEPGSNQAHHYPELISRRQIRQTPPQILFTNPSMLEYLLVRNKDVPLLKNSQGKLRWILLDEAHTLKGSYAAEMSLLIRRIIDAFGVDIKKIRFAITSATVGTDAEGPLKKFMSDLCGISEDSIHVVLGNRVFAQALPTPDLFQPIPDTILDGTINPIRYREIHDLRTKILAEQGGLLASNLSEILNSPNLDTTLKLVDKLSETYFDGKSVFPVRGHFFVRGVNGMFVCVNKNCNKHPIDKSIYRNMTTNVTPVCVCGSPMYEIVSCNACGHQLLEANREMDTEGDEYLKMVSKSISDPFGMDIAELDEGDVISDSAVDKFYFTPNHADQNYVSESTDITLEGSGKIIYAGADFKFAVNSHSVSLCAHCGETVTDPFHYRLSSSFINRILADVILEETPAEQTLNPEMLWEGRKYISFTDSRQGTAKVSALINQDKEASWVRAQLFHRLSELQKQINQATPPIDSVSINNEIHSLRSAITPEMADYVKETLENKIHELFARLTTKRLKAQLNWQQFANYILQKDDSTRLFRGNNPNDNSLIRRQKYISAIMYTQFSRRLRRTRSLENLGMIRLVFPSLTNAVIPPSASFFNLNQDEWQNLLKIAVDYEIRYKQHIYVDDQINSYKTSYLRSYLIYDYDSTLENVKRWTQLEDHGIRVSRLPLLICAGLGYHDRDVLTADIIDRINKLLQDIWTALKSYLLTLDNQGFRLNLEEKAVFELCERSWLCPATNRLIDLHFRGYSPWISGQLTSQNIQQYRVERHVDFPEFPYPFNIEIPPNVNIKRTRDWINEQSRALRDVGVWNNLHEQVILNQPIYLAGEHSAQQGEKRLKELELSFEKGKLNVLNCSTTMEMGVDIGGISVVLMNNVPPSPANYLQRAGRAGRRSEAKSLALTICSPSPIGLNAMSNPQWALKHRIAPPYVTFQSETVVLRHLHAFFLSRFVQTDHISGLPIKIDVKTFFIERPDGQDTLALLFKSWLINLDINGFISPISKIVSNTPIAYWTARSILEECINAFDDLVYNTSNHYNSFNTKIDSLSQLFGNNSPAAKAAIFQLKRFITKNTITYLVEEGFLPSAGMPTGIVEFDTFNIDNIVENNEPKSKPSYFITRALTEFAPGNEIVLDGKTYVSDGVVLHNELNGLAQHELLQQCGKCGYQRIVKVDNSLKYDNCSNCNEDSFTGLDLNGTRGRYTELIQPVGFSVDLFKSSTRIINPVSTVQYIDPLLINVKPWAHDSNALFECRESDVGGEILFYNSGRWGNGYALCLHCGRTASNPEVLKNHKRLRGGKNKDESTICSGNNDGSYAIRENIVLGGRFKTDFTEIRVRHSAASFSKNETLLYTLGSVLTKTLSSFIGIEESEVDFGVKKYKDYSTLFIFDNAKGGSGYSIQFPVYAHIIFETAREILSQCNCEKACTKCLIDRKSQWSIDKLDRNIALEWLEEILSLKVPAFLSDISPTCRHVIGNIYNEITRLAFTKKIEEIWLYVSSSVDGWKPDNLRILKQLRDKVPINLILINTSLAWTPEEKVTLIQCKQWFKLYCSVNNQVETFNRICSIKVSNGKKYHYLAEEFQSNLDESWGTSSNGHIFRLEDIDEADLLDLVIPIDTQKVVEVLIVDEDVREIPSNRLFSLIERKLNGKTDLFEMLRGESLEVVYSDTYLETPIGCLLLAQLVQEFRNKYHFEISRFVFRGRNQINEPKGEQNGVFDNVAHRNDTVKTLFEEMGIEKVIISTDSFIPHFRYLEFSNDKVCLRIRPDGGIEHGWVKSRSDLNKIKYPLSLNHIYRIYKQGRPILYTISS